MRHRHLVLTILALLAALVAPPARALEPESRRAVEEIVRDYLLKHPETILESVQAHQSRQQAAERDRIRELLVARQREIVSDPTGPVGGNPEGDVTVVEFFDYRCGYCKAVAGTVQQLVAEDRGVRVVYREFPVLGPESVTAAQAALAARGQGKYVELHEALMKASEPLTWPAISRVAAGVGLDVARLERDMKAPEVRAAIERTRTLARDLGIRGTPAFIVGSELAPGAVDLAGLKALVARARGR